MWKTPNGTEWLSVRTEYCARTHIRSRLVQIGILWCCACKFHAQTITLTTISMVFNCMKLPTYSGQWERESKRRDILRVLVLLPNILFYVILIWWATRDTGSWEIQWVLKVKREWLWHGYRKKMWLWSLCFSLSFSPLCVFHFIFISKFWL